MGLELPNPAAAPASSGTTVEMDCRLYLDESGKRLVEEGHAQARWLWCVPGSRVTRAEADRLGAFRKSDPEPEPEETPEPEPEPEAEQEQEPEPKRRGRPPGNKGRPKQEDKQASGDTDKGGW